MKTRIFIALALIAILAGCVRRADEAEEKPTPTPAPTPAQTPTPVPSPTPIYVPAKRLEVSKLFNGMQLRSSVETEFGTTATNERNTPASYALDLQLKVQVPKPNSDLQQIAALNDQLPIVLPGLATMLPAAKVSPFFDRLYRLKVNALRQNLARLDLLLSRHNFYDCETVLELQDPTTRRHALLIQADMDIDMDGSDSDRVPLVDGSSANYQPMTSYQWPKKTAVPNQFLASRETKLKQLEDELAAKTAGAERAQELRTLIPELRYEVNRLKSHSFLVATTDPYIVLPGSLVTKDGQPFTPQVGDYCVVIYKNTLYPLIVGDVGPSNKMGEGSYRIGKEINARASANNRPVSDLKVTYLVFPNSADKPFDAPDLEKWRTRCEQLLNEIGGCQGELHTWENLIKPPPTPTPTPSPSPTPTPSATPASSPSPGATPAKIGWNHWIAPPGHSTPPDAQFSASGA